VGARLQYAKVIDRRLYFERGARVHPGLENKIVVNGEPGVAGAFLVLRAWTDDHGSFTESWRIETPGGQTIYKSTPRELHLATTTHAEHLEDEVVDLKLDYAGDGYQVVFTLDDHEVARVEFPAETEDPSR
jgi:subtilisin family serine protease